MTNPEENWPPGGLDSLFSPESIAEFEARERLGTKHLVYIDHKWVEHIEHPETMNRYAKESAERNKNAQIVEVVDRYEGCIEIFKLLPPESARCELRGRLFTKILSYSIYDYKWEEILEDPEIVNKWAKESAERNKNTQIVEVDNGNGEFQILKVKTADLLKYSNYCRDILYICCIFAQCLGN